MAIAYDPITTWSGTWVSFSACDTILLLLLQYCVHKNGVGRSQHTRVVDILVSCARWHEVWRTRGGRGVYTRCLDIRVQLYVYQHNRDRHTTSGRHDNGRWKWKTKSYSYKNVTYYYVPIYIIIIFMYIVLLDTDRVTPRVSVSDDNNNSNIIYYTTLTAQRWCWWWLALDRLFDYPLLCRRHSLHSLTSTDRVTRVCRKLQTTLRRIIDIILSLFRLLQL